MTDETQVPREALASVLVRYGLSELHAREAAAVLVAEVASHETDQIDNLTVESVLDVSTWSEVDDAQGLLDALDRIGEALLLVGDAMVDDPSVPKKPV